MTVTEMLKKHPCGCGCFASAAERWNEYTQVFEDLKDAVTNGITRPQNCEVLPEKDHPIPHCHGVSLTSRQKAELYRLLRKD